jgi:hypothetical protein
MLGLGLAPTDALFFPEPAGVSQLVPRAWEGGCSLVWVAA